MVVLLIITRCHFRVCSARRQQTETNKKIQQIQSYPRISFEFVRSCRDLFLPRPTSPSTVEYLPHRPGGQGFAGVEAAKACPTFQRLAPDHPQAGGGGRQYRPRVATPRHLAAAEVAAAAAAVHGAIQLETSMDHMVVRLNEASGALQDQLAEVGRASRLNAQKEGERRLARILDGYGLQSG